MINAKKEYLERKNINKIILTKKYRTFFLPYKHSKRRLKALLSAIYKKLLIFYKVKKYCLK
jgi:hypothetical protein